MQLLFKEMLNVGVQRLERIFNGFFEIQKIIIAQSKVNYVLKIPSHLEFCFQFILTIDLNLKLILAYLKPTKWQEQSTIILNPKTI